MPLMKPLMSLLNFTPSSTAFPSVLLGRLGTIDGCQRLVHGQVPGVTDTGTLGPGGSTLPLSSMARLRIVTEPVALGIQSKVHVDTPWAVCHVVPPSTETWTAAAAPSTPLSAASPEMVTRLPLVNTSFCNGDAMCE